MTSDVPYPKDAAAELAAWAWATPSSYAVDVSRLIVYGNESPVHDAGICGPYQNGSSAQPSLTAKVIVEGLIATHPRPGAAPLSPPRYVPYTYHGVPAHHACRMV